MFGSIAISLVLVITAIYIYNRGGITAMLRARRERREAKKQAQDIEMVNRNAEERDGKIVDQQAMETLEGLYQNNTLVGASPPIREGKRVFVEVPVDPMAYMWGSGKEMARMYQN